MRRGKRQAVAELTAVPGLMAKALRSGKRDRDGRRTRSQSASSVLYLGRGTSYPLSLEGALKLKEISYIHAEGYAAGELKHGPIALIDEDMPVDRDRAGRPRAGEDRVQHAGGRRAPGQDRVDRRSAMAHRRRRRSISPMRLELAPMPPTFAPIVYAVPVQLLAYHAAVFMGKDVDQPRNLAKSVTVE